MMLATEKKQLNILKGAILNYEKEIHHKEFIEILKNTTSEFFNGNAQTSKDYNRIINEFHTKRLADLIENCPKENLLCGGKSEIKDRYIEPTIFSFDSISAFKNINLSKDEIFGPIMYTAPYNEIRRVYRIHKLKR